MGFQAGDSASRGIEDRLKGKACGLGILTIGLAIGAAIFPPLIRGAAIEQKSISCERNMRAISQALAQYSEDWDETYPPAKRWMDLIEQPSHQSSAAVDPTHLAPLSPSAVSCPAVARYGYAMNANLSCVPLSSIGPSLYLVVLFETDDLERNAAGVQRDMAKTRHIDCNIALMNGNVSWVNQYWLTNAEWSTVPRVGDGGK
jgi:hypothetical protein